MNFGNSKLEIEVVGKTSTGHKWQYPSAGFHNGNGVWMIDDQSLATIELQPIAIRQCKEVGYRDMSNKWLSTLHRYHPMESKETIKSVMGFLPVVSDQKASKRMRIQILGLINGELRLWGSDSFSVRWFWLNPEKGNWNNDSFDTGYLQVLDEWRKAMLDEHGRDSSMFYWKSTLASDKEMTNVGFNGNVSYAKLIRATSEPVYAGDESVTELSEFYVTEDITGWIAEWENAEASDVEEEEPVDPRDEQGEAPNPAMMNDEPEDTEIPF